MEKTILDKTTNLTQVEIEGEQYYKISNSDALRPFFMTIVSEADHWLFVSSNGGLTAGRRNADHALFPYYTDDKITESIETTGCKTIVLLQCNGETIRWEPFSDRQQGRYHLSRHLYKSIYGHKLLFEEENHDLQLSFRYEWNSSDRFGFVRKASLTNHALQDVELRLLDGLQNILPHGVGSALQQSRSNLVDAYKRSELDPETGLGIYALSAIIVDRAEPSEALKANVVWSVGLDNPAHLLSSLQLDAFRKGLPIVPETDVKAERGAYLLTTQLQLEAGGTQKWMLVADVSLNHSSIVALADTLRREPKLTQLVKADVQLGAEKLIALCAAADGLQQTANHRQDSRHFSNVLFNIMRGGIFDDHYRIQRADLMRYLAKANRALATEQAALMESLPEITDIDAVMN
ncbi:MAG: hypothetical protein AAFO94_14810, partial [Bacteroidota bacterium]